MNLHRAPVLLCCATFAFACTDRLAAQSTGHVTVPAAHAASDAPGLALWPFTGFDSRSQIVVDRSALSLPGSAQIDGFAVRRNAGDTDVLPAARVDLVVELSNARTAARLASATFADNRGPQPVVAFQGVVALPTTPPVGAAVAPWAAPYAISIPFQAPYQLRGSGICIETRTRPYFDPILNVEDDVWWPVDAFVRGDTGTVRQFGTGCVPGLAADAADAVATTWLPGGLGVFSLEGPRAGALTTCVIGISDRLFGLIPLPLPLDPLGAPGCSLHIDPAYGVVASLDPFPSGPRAGAHVRVAIPTTAAVTGAHVYSQWFVNDVGTNPLGLTATNAVDATIGAVGSDLGAAWVESTDLAATTGRVLFGRLPVIRFDYH